MPAKMPSLLLILVAVMMCSPSAAANGRKKILRSVFTEVLKEIEESNTRELTPAQIRFNTYKQTTPDIYAHGIASLKFERMVKLAEKKIRLNTDQPELDKCNATNQPHGSMLTSKELRAIMNESGCLDAIGEQHDCSQQFYRAADGTCNNLKNPTWGASSTAFHRIMDSNYEDGVSAPRGFAQSQYACGGDEGPFMPPIPSPKVVVKRILTDVDKEDKMHSLLLMQFGQFVAHDIALLTAIKSCPSTCIITDQYEDSCYPFVAPVEHTDIMITMATSSNCVDFPRSLGVCQQLKGGILAPREQLNAATHFLDASTVYGYTQAIQDLVRDTSTGAPKGILKEGKPAKTGSQLPLLPDAPNKTVVLCANYSTCFLAGDFRVNLQEALTTLHTIWFREHNRIAKKIAKLNPTYTSDDVFQVSRQIVIAELQKITYEDYLPIIFGPMYYPLLVGNYTGYNDNVDPSTPNSYDAGAGRFGHSMVQTTLLRLDEGYKPSPEGNLLLADAFLNTSSLREYGTDPLARGLLQNPSRFIDQYFSATLFHQLLSENAASPGMDLISINIQRGRDHGLTTYTEWRDWAQTECNVTSDINSTTQQKFMEVYGGIDSVDLYTGGVAETHIKGGLVGATFGCILSKTFQNVRTGDRFFYRNQNLKYKLTTAQLNEIEKVTHSGIICDNTDIKTIQKNAFIGDNDRVPCSEIYSLNLDPWKNNNQHVEL